MEAQDDEPCAFAKLWGQLDGAPFQAYVTQLPSTLGRGSLATEGERRSRPSGFIELGRSKALSREHAVISWIPEKKSYQITCMSKNGMVVAGSYHAKGGVEKLESRAPIKLGPASMYFLLPEKNATPEPQPAPAPAPAVAAAQTTPIENPQAPPSSQALPPPPENGSSAALKRPTTTAAAATVADPAAAAVAAVPMALSFLDMVLGAFRSQELSAVAAASGGLSSGDVQNWIMQTYPEWSQEGSRMKIAVGINRTLEESFVSRGEDRWTEVSPEPSAKRMKHYSPDNGAPTPTVAAAITAAAAAAAAPAGGAAAAVTPPGSASSGGGQFHGAKKDGGIDLSGIS